MRTIKFTKKYKKDLKREIKRYGKDNLKILLDSAFNFLLNDFPLPKRFCDHPLHGEWDGFRDCHIRPDLVLIYKINNNDLILTRMGSHGELSI